MKLIWGAIIVVVLYVLFILGNIALGHAEAPWLATFVNASGTPCCVDGEHGDCVRITHEQAWSVGIGDYLDLNFRGELRRVLVNSVYATQDGKAYGCLPGCVFKGPGV